MMKKDVSESDKYWYKEFYKLYRFESSFNTKLTLELIKQYYECAIIREKWDNG